MSGATPVNSANVRVRGLDGLRGVAALVVVVSHVLLLDPEIMRSFYDPHSRPPTGLAWALVYTPLHLFWEGSAAVFIFFVLSGFVLTLPFVNRPRNWLAYYPSRMIRLYLPVWAAVVLAVGAAVFVPHLQAGDRWVQAHRQPTAGAVITDLVLIARAPGLTNSALWSLRWEVVFSLFLPLFISFAVILRRLAVLKVVLLLTLCFTGALAGGADFAPGFPALFQLPIFAIGSVLAVEWERLSSAVRGSLRDSARVVLVGLVIVTLLTSYWMASGLELGSRPVLLLALTRVLGVIGAVAVLVMVGALPAWGTTMSRPRVVWLGSRSFSLYLVHEPVVTALGHLLPAPVSPVISLPISIPISLLAAEGFFRVVERPSHRLSRRIARSVSTWRAARHEGRVPPLDTSGGS